MAALESDDNVVIESQWWPEGFEILGGNAEKARQNSLNKY
jgi:hypothetical protein